MRLIIYKFSDAAYGEVDSEVDSSLFDVIYDNSSISNSSWVC